MKLRRYGIRIDKETGVELCFYDLPNGEFVRVEDLRVWLETEEKEALEHFTPEACDGLFYLSHKLLASLNEKEAGK